MALEKLFIRYATTLSILFLGGCGYFSDEPVEDGNVAFVSNVLEGNCNVSQNAEDISDILDRDISESINCLRNSINTYVKLSKRKDPNFISYDEIGRFIRENLALPGDNVDGNLSLFFRLANVLLNEPANRLSVRNIDPMFDILILFNRDGTELKKAIDGANNREESENFLKYSRRFSTALNSLVGGVRPYVDQNLAGSKSGHSINFKEFILDIFNGDTFSDLEIDEESLEALLAFKPLFLGGDRISLNATEVQTLLKVSSEDLLTSVFNLYFANEKDLENQVGYLNYFQKNFNNISKNFYPKLNERTEITTQDEIDMVLRKYFSSMDDIDFLQVAAKEVKNKLIDGKDSYSEIYTYKNVKALFALADLGLDAYIYYLRNETLFKGEEVFRPGFTTRGRVTKQDFVGATSNLATAMKSKLNQTNIFPPQVEYFDFFLFLNDEIEDINIDIDFLNAAVGFKSLLAGGKKDITNRLEIFTVLDKLEFIGSLYYNLTSLDFNTISSRELWELALSDIREFRDNIELTSAFAPVVTANNLATIAEYLMDDGKNYKNFAPLIESLKVKLIKGYQDVFIVRDFVALADLMEGFVEKMYFAEITFDLINPDRRNQKTIKVKESELKDPDYFQIPIENQIVYLEELNQILNTYRYYRDDNGYSYYGNTVKRHVRGLREIVAVKWAAELLFPFYAEWSEEQKNWVLTIEKLDAVLQEFRPALEYFELWSNSISTFGRNILLLADLFQEQSDGTLDINPVETAEYGGLVFMAVQTGMELLETMVDNGYCKNIGTADDIIIENECYRSYLFKTMLSDLGLRRYLPKLYDYVVGSEMSEIYNFIRSVEGFARDNDDGKTNKRASMLIFGAMLNIESTLIRFDINQDNILDFGELESGLEIYYGAVANLSELAGGNFEYLVPKAYFYMIDKMKLPPESKVAAFATLTAYSLPEKIRAKRINVGKLLEGIIKQADGR